MIARARHLEAVRRFYHPKHKLAAPPGCDTLGHMKSVNVRELHEKTGSIVALAAEGHVVVVVKRGVPVAEIRPLSAAARRRTLPDRARLLARYPRLRGDRGRFLEDDRS